ncbi:MAG: hypothetical protein JETCAE03_31980 [Ignavibacteriaceae bacterium]|jgi:hypothetical protein|nr:MAG: hypothetical protein JETCAE03_31980 [Ignavibacteriaceae bacterium]
MGWLNDEEFVYYLHEDDLTSIAEHLFPADFDLDNDENHGLTKEQIQQAINVKNAVYEVGVVVNVTTGKIVRLEKDS